MEIDAFGNVLMSPMTTHHYVKGAMNNPEIKKMMGAMGETMSLEDVLSMLAQMSPEEIAAQLEGITDVIGGEDFLEKSLENPDSVIKSLETSGMFPPEHLEELRSSPEKLRNAMKGAIEQLNEHLNNPMMLASASEKARSLHNLMGDPERRMETVDEIKEYFGYQEDVKAQLMTELQDDEAIEELRLALLAGDYADLDNLIQSEDMQEVLKDSEKWKEAVEVMINGGLK